MTAAKHTPGPWRIWTSCSFRRISSAATGKDGDVLCAVVQRSDGHPDLHFSNGGFDGPDARLITAAPEMLHELRLAHRNILNALSVMTPEQKDEWARKNRADDCDGEGTTRYHERAAVIAKATGSAQ